MTTGRWRSPG